MYLEPGEGQGREAIYNSVVPTLVRWLVENVSVRERRTGTYGIEYKLRKEKIYESHESSFFLTGAVEYSNISLLGNTIQSKGVMHI
jgi:hypothetical protein